MTTLSTPQRTQAPGRVRRRNRSRYVRNAALTGVALIAIAPILWGFFTSIRGHSAALVFPPEFGTDNFTLSNYSSVWTGTGVSTQIFNTLVMGVGASLLAVLIGLHAAYAASRLTFRFRNAIMAAILVTAMVPGVAVLPGLYVAAQWSGIHDTYSVLILVYAAWRLPIVVWVLKTFIDDVPRDLEEAAMIDGCGRIQALYRIVAPLVTPGMVATGLVTFLYVWNDFVFASALTISVEMRNVQFGLYQFMGDVGIQWAQFMAYTILISIPAILLFIVLQRRFVEGLSAGAVKG